MQPIARSFWNILCHTYGNVIMGDHCVVRPRGISRYLPMYVVLMFCIHRISSDQQWWMGWPRELLSNVMRMWSRSIKLPASLLLSSKTCCLHIITTSTLTKSPNGYLTNVQTSLLFQYWNKQFKFDYIAWPKWRLFSCVTNNEILNKAENSVEF